MSTIFFWFSCIFTNKYIRYNRKNKYCYVHAFSNFRSLLPSVKFVGTFL
jgi:hypothetical protein